LRRWISSFVQHPLVVILCQSGYRALQSPDRKKQSVFLDAAYGTPDKLKYRIDYSRRQILSLEALPDVRYGLLAAAACYSLALGGTLSERGGLKRSFFLLLLGSVENISLSVQTAVCNDSRINF
jgi:hypothetical protein